MFSWQIPSKFHLAVVTGNLNAVRALIEQGVDISEYYGVLSTIQLALFSNHLAIVKLLIEMGCNINGLLIGFGDADLETRNFIEYQTGIDQNRLNQMKKNTSNFPSSKQLLLTF